jgi:osmoprotectant transport system ATP-binding protein
MTGMIELEHVDKIFPGQAAPAVGDLSLDVPEGEIVVLIGPSGCGKSTTLRMINRLIEPTSGRITVAGKDVNAQKPHELRLAIGYVIQQVGLFPHRTIARNIATVPELLGWDRARVKARVEELMDLVGLEPELGSRYPSELSGGQQQRAGVARALAADPPVLLMDEPFGAVDPIVRLRLQEELLGLQRQVRKTIVFVTHDIDEAIRLGDRMAVLNVGGVLEQYGAPVDVLAEPANPFVVDFLGADRGIKRLGLLPVSSAEILPGPTVDIGASRDEARAVMDRERVDWVAVLEHGIPRGWITAAALEGHTRVDEVERTPFALVVSPTDSLKHALDALVSSPTQVVVVVDAEGRYKGILDVARIGKGLAT